MEIESSSIKYKPMEWRARENTFFSEGFWTQSNIHIKFILISFLFIPPCWMIKHTHTHTRITQHKICVVQLSPQTTIKYNKCIYEKWRNTQFNTCEWRNFKRLMNVKIRNFICQNGRIEIKSLIQSYLAAKKKCKYGRERRAHIVSSNSILRKHS